MYILDNLKDLRKKEGMTQIDLAKKIGVTMNSIARWELGANKPSEENLDKLRETFGIKGDKLDGEN